MGIIKTAAAAALQERFNWLLRPLGFVYSGIMSVRERAYKAGFPASYSSCIPCVSVGNIGWGGSGKTPLVDWLLNWAAGAGLGAAVLSRGYGGAPPSLPWLVRPGDQAWQTGDEPLLLASRHPEAQVWVDPLRSRAVKHIENSLAANLKSGDGPPNAASNFEPGVAPNFTPNFEPEAASNVASNFEPGVAPNFMPNFEPEAASNFQLPDLLIMDDGFQHLALERDLDLLLLRPEDLGQGWNMVIPAGSWREGKQALARASAFLCKINPRLLPEAAPRFKDRLRVFKRPLFCFDLQPQGLRLLTRPADAGKNRAGGLARVSPPFFSSPPQGKSRRHEDPQGTQGGRHSELLEDIGGQPYVFTAGLARPEEAARSLSDFLGYAAEKYYFYEDHHAFSVRDAQTLAAHGLPVACTGKDAVKLAGLLDYFAPAPIYVLESSPRFVSCLFTGQSFEDWWRESWQKIHQSKSSR